MTDSDRFEIMRSHEGAQMLKANWNGRPLVNYFTKLKKLYNDTPLSDRITRAAYEFEPYDHEMKGIDLEYKLAATLFHGALPGILISHICLTPMQRRIMWEYDLQIPVCNDMSSDDFPDVQSASYAAHTELAVEGWAMAEPYYGGLYAGWATAGFADPKYYPTFRNGMGLIFHLASVADDMTKVLEIAELAKQGEGLDWSEGLAELGSVQGS